MHDMVVLFISLIPQNSLEIRTIELLWHISRQHQLHILKYGILQYHKFLIIVPEIHTSGEPIRGAELLKPMLDHEVRGTKPSASFRVPKLKVQSPPKVDDLVSV